MPNENYNAIRDHVFRENTAQGVLRDIKQLQDNQAWVRTRWIWELLQNARDAKATEIFVKHVDDKLIFQHNGRPFTGYEICHLIYHGSTKAEDADTIGQYGTGFLTTHLLSHDIRISGHENNQRFRFWLRRNFTSVDDLMTSMDRSWDAFQEGCTNDGPSTEFTEFLYPLSNEDSEEAVRSGIETLRHCAPFIVIFNRQFSLIEVQSGQETATFEVLASSKKSENVELWTVREDDYNRKYCVAQDDVAQVAIPLEVSENIVKCSVIRNIPKLFLAFPLIGTEDFCLPAIINSLHFTPIPDRSGVVIRSGTEGNQKNQQIIEKSCSLLVSLVDFAASSGWHKIHELATVPAIPGHNWLDVEWIKTCIKENLLSRLRMIPMVINKSGNPVAPSNLKIPFANGEQLSKFWGLLDEWIGYTDVLPRQDEAAGWLRAAISWAAISDIDDVSKLREIFDGNDMAEDVHRVSHDPDADPPTYRISRLNINADTDKLGWIDRFISFLMSSGMRDALTKWRVVPSQAGFLRTLDDLHRDVRVDDELKEIGDIRDEWRVRPVLRENILSLAAEAGAGDHDNGDVADVLIRSVNSAALDQKCMDASARLFAWMIGHNEWDRLLGLRLFSEIYYEGQQAKRANLKLDLESESPLAPVSSWDKELQSYSALFPKRHTLASIYFNYVTDQGTWAVLEGKHLVVRDVIVRHDKQVRFISEDDEHLADPAVPVTDIRFLTRGGVGIMERVRRSGELARKLWAFLTEYMVQRDSDGLQLLQAPCECGEEHEYYPAQWIGPLSDNRWVPVHGIPKQASAQSLAEMLRGHWRLDATNADIVRFLHAIGVEQLELILALTVEDGNERRQKRQNLTEILASADNNLPQVRQFAEDLRADHELPRVLDERRKFRTKVRQNQDLGALVTELVRETLLNEGFEVTSTGIDADFRMEHDDAARLELTRDDRKWIVEVKATRHQAVRMTVPQAKTAVREAAGFLLCVVPISDKVPCRRTVGTTMRFVSDIGAQLGDLCDRWDNYEQFRRGITGGGTDGIQLVVKSGSARVQIANAIWQGGFPLTDLPDRLG